MAASAPPHHGVVEIAELVLKYVEALTWPLVTVGLVWGLRRHVQAAFTRMTRLETPAGAIEFTSDARDVRFEAEELATTPGEADEPSTSAEEQESRFGVFQEAWDTAETSPIGALITAWLTLDAICNGILVELDAMPTVGPARMVPTHKKIEALAGAGLSPRAVSVFHDLRQLRNRALHGVDVVTSVAAKDFVESARYVARQVHTLPNR